MSETPPLRLFVVMLGGRHPGARIEVHDVVLVAGARLEHTFDQLRTQWFGAPAGLHVDSWLEVDGIEGWKIRFSDAAPTAGAPRLFFVNLGGYLPGVFGESHGYGLIVAEDVHAAKRKAKAQTDSRWSKPHRDALFEVDDCLPLDRAGQRYVHLVAGVHAGVRQDSRYIVLS